MSQHSDPETRLFLEEVRDFLADELTPELKRAAELCAGIYCDRPAAQEWLSILNNRGWAVPHWPVEYGGTDWSISKIQLFQTELALASAPAISPNSTHMVAPVVIAFGTDEQKKTLLPRIRSGEDWWAQGYSEPGSGSDLASLQTRAVRDGDHYVINGTKIWTTHAHWSNKIFCLVRTDNTGKKQQGITFLLMDLDLPGVTVAPIHSISGEHELNQVFFDDVRTPVSSLLGQENDGWTVAKYLLQHERATIASPYLKVALERVKRAARAGGNVGGGALIEDPVFRRKVSEAEIDLFALTALEDQILAAAEAGGSAGVLSSALKIRATELKQRISEVGVTAAGHFAFAFQHDALQPDSKCRARWAR